MPIYQDHLGRKADIPASPQRIISLCPSITETLIDFGLGNRVVGRTRFCIHPKDDVKDIVRVGGTKEIKYDRLHNLKPDLIVAEKEENTLEMVSELEKSYPVFVTDVVDIDSGLKMIKDLGRITNRNSIAERFLEEIQAAWETIPIISHSPKVLYLIWEDPTMIVGGNTFIDSVLEKLGLENLGKIREGRYPEINHDLIRQLEPDMILLSSEPYPFKKEHIQLFEKLVPKAKVSLVDGEMFSWYGSRMLKAADYFKQWVLQ